MNCFNRCLRLCGAYRKSLRYDQIGLLVYDSIWNPRRYPKASVWQPTKKEPSQHHRETQKESELGSKRINHGGS